MALKIKNGKLVIPESSIEKAVTTLLECDGWRSFKMEQNFSPVKMKIVGEAGMPDHLYIRYREEWSVWPGLAQVLWIEYKSAKGKLSASQRIWHEAENKRGAWTLIAGIDFKPSLEGFCEWYRNSGLMRRKI